MTEHTVKDNPSPEAGDSTDAEAVASQVEPPAAPQGELIEDGGIAIEVQAEGEGEGDDQGAETEPEAADIDPAQARIAELEAQLEALEKAKADTYDRMVRTSADFDNFRKRSRREVEDARVDARSRTLKEILPVIDNLERALAHSETSGPDGAAGIVDGVKLVMRQFAQGLARLEVVALEALGKPFDPAVHEAISQMPTDEHPPGTVAAVVQTGYKIGERLLRPAMVVVATALPKPAPVEGGNGADPDAPIAASGDAESAHTTDTAETPAAEPTDAGDIDDEAGDNEAS